MSVRGLPDHDLLSRWALALAALLAGLLALMLLAPPARAVEPAAGDAGQIVWRCWLDPATGSAAFCARPGAEAADLVLEPAPADPRATRRAVLAGGCVARLVREQPALHGRGLWRIPLHTVPYNDLRWPRLLEAVMCGSEAACRVEIGPPRAVATAP